LNFVNLGGGHKSQGGFDLYPSHNEFMIIIQWLISSTIRIDFIQAKGIVFYLDEIICKTEKNNDNKDRVRHHGRYACPGR
jgi:hypothetical protein